jgi:flagellar basal body-associated protein FliL
MQSLLLGVAVLACPVGMGLMMWMMRGQGKDTAASEDHSRQQEVEALRAEIEQLKAEGAADRTAGGQ